MDLFKMAGLDASEFSSNDNKTSKRPDANATNASSSSKRADTDHAHATNAAKDVSTESDYQTSDIQYEEATNHDLADVKRERDRIGVALMIKESILHDLKVQLAMLKRGSDGSESAIKYIDTTKSRINDEEESLAELRAELEKLK